jgi:hypothetical protein
MPVFKRPKPLIVSVDHWAALIAAEYLQAAAKKEKSPTLSSMLDYVASEMIDSVRKTYPRIKAEHLLEQSEALAQELLHGKDRLWEEQHTDDGTIQSD